MPVAGFQVDPVGQLGSLGIINGKGNIKILSIPRRLSWELTVVGVVDDVDDVVDVVDVVDGVVVVVVVSSGQQSQLQSPHT